MSVAFQVFRECAAARRVETVSGLWKLYLVLLDQCQQLFDAAVDEALVQQSGSNEHAASSASAASAARKQGQQEQGADLEAGGSGTAGTAGAVGVVGGHGFEPRIGRIEREHRAYALRQLRVQRRHAEELELEEKRLTLRVHMLRGVADAVESATRAGSERQLAVRDEVSSHVRIASAIDASVSTLTAAVQLSRDRYYERARLFGARKATFDAASVTLADLKKSVRIGFH